MGVEADDPRYVLQRNSSTIPSKRAKSGRMNAFRLSHPSVRPTQLTRLDVCSCCRSRDYPRVRSQRLSNSSSSGRWGQAASAVTKSTITLAAENRRNAGSSPTLRDKIQSRAGNIAGHLRNNSNSHPFSTTTTTSATSSTTSWSSSSSTTNRTHWKIDNTKRQLRAFELLTITIIKWNGK